MPKLRNSKGEILRVLFIGDIVGEVGRSTVKALLSILKKRYSIDFVIANGEHLSDRVGLEIKYVDQMVNEGIDFFTTGNHVWKKKDFEEHIGKADVPVIRPANFSKPVPGDGYSIVETKKGKILIANLLGRENMDTDVQSPFDVADKILSTAKDYQYSIFDFHAEMTSEKVALGQYLDGRVSAVLCTHTHVATADQRILPGGTAYVTDVGMTGPLDSVLGVTSEIIIDRFKSGLPQKFEVAGGRGLFNAVLVELDQNGKAQKIKRMDKILRRALQQ